MTLHDARAMLRRWGAVTAFCARQQRNIDDLRRQQVAAAEGGRCERSKPGGRGNQTSDPTHAAVAMMEQYQASIEAAQEAIAAELEFARRVDAVVCNMEPALQEVLYERYVLRWTVGKIAVKRSYDRRSIYRMMDKAEATLLAYEQPLKLYAQTTCCHKMSQ